MTENANPKPFNISRQKFQARENSFIGFISQQSTDPFTVKLDEQNSKMSRTIKNAIGSFTDWVNPLFVIIKWRLSFVGLVTKMTDQVWK